MRLVLGLVVVLGLTFVGCGSFDNRSEDRFVADTIVEFKQKSADNNKPVAGFHFYLWRSTSRVTEDSVLAALRSYYHGGRTPSREGQACVMRDFWGSGQGRIAGCEEAIAYAERRGHLSLHSRVRAILSWMGNGYEDEHEGMDGRYYHPQLGWQEPVA